MNKITRIQLENKIFGIEITREYYWYCYKFEFDRGNKISLFRSMCNDEDIFIKHNWTYTQYIYWSRKNTDEVYNNFIISHNVKSAILNMNHSDIIIKLISRFIVCCRNEYELCDNVKVNSLHE